MTTAGDASMMTQDQAIELHDAYWYAQCAMEGKVQGRTVRGEKAKASSRAEAMRLALMSFAAAGADVDAARFPFSTPAELAESSAILMEETADYGFARGVITATAMPLPRTCSCCCYRNTTWSDRCEDCSK